MELGDHNIEISATHDALWAIIRRLCQGGVPLRLAYRASPFDWSLQDCARHLSVAGHGVDLIAEGRIDVKPMVTRRFYLDDINRAFGTAQDKEGPARCS
jgi:threonine dehydrogenase-like Zn-dependent dehydrogenase